MANKDADTMVCRCEDISREKILACIADGYETLDEIKRVTRAGMGPCQGRMCGPTVSALVAETGRSLAEAGGFQARPPAKPVTVAGLAAAWRGADDDGLDPSAP